MTSTDPTETLAELLSWTSGDMTRYSPDAHPDHNRWSWRGDGHPASMFGQFRDQARQILAAGWLPPSGTPPETAPSCVCPTDDYCPRCHPRWHAKWRTQPETAAGSVTEYGVEIEYSTGWELWGDPWPTEAEARERIERLRRDPEHTRVVSRTVTPWKPLSDSTACSCVEDQRGGRSDFTCPLHPRRAATDTEGDQR